MADGNFHMEIDPETGDAIYDTAPALRPKGVPTMGHFDNLVGVLEQRTVDSLLTTLLDRVDEDEDGRSGWAQIGVDAYKLLGIGPESDPDTQPGAEDTSDNPLMLTALTRFQSKALAALLPSGHRAVRTEASASLDDIEDPEERDAVDKATTEAGARVERFYSDYLFKRLKNYETDTDQILHDTGMMGAGIRKIHVDRTRRRTPVQPMHVAPSDLILSYNAASFSCGRVTHRIRMTTSQLVRAIKLGQYSVEVGKRPTPSSDGKTELENEIDRIMGLSGDYSGDEVHTLYEVHCDLYLTEDEHAQQIARPYIVTIHKSSQIVLSVVRNWEEHDPDEDRIEHFVVYPFSPGKSATTPMGLGHLLSNITRALRDAQRAGLEAAYLQNHPSGFKLSTFKIRDDATPMRAGEFVDVDSPVDDIRKALMIQPFDGPSPGLMALAEKMEANGKELGGLATIDFAQLMKAGIAAGPAMAAYEESASFQTAIHRRLYNAMELELRMIHTRMRQIFGNSPVPYGTNGLLHPGDLIMVDILPAMRPGEASKQKTLLEAQAIVDMAQAMPDVINQRKAAMKMLRALGEPNIDDLLQPDPEDNPPEPADPITEYGRILQGEPVVAGPSQNHRAHIDAHAAQMKLLGTSQLPVEKGDAAMAVLAAHIAEHMAMEALVAAAAATGIPLETFQQGIPPELEAQIAPQLAASIQQMETERRPAEPGSDRVAVEQVKQQGKQTELTLKQQHEQQLQTLKHQQALELQRLKDSGAMERETADNEAALEIAAMRGGQGGPDAGTRANAGAGAGLTSRAAAGIGGTER